MDVTLSTKDHRAALDAATDALPRRSGILPSLLLVRIEAHADGRITYQGTDLDFAIEAEAHGEVRTPGSLCLPGAQLAGIARESDPEGRTRLRADGAACRVEAGSSRFRLAASPASEYVGGPPAPAEAGVEVSGDVLRAMASRVARTTAREESGGALCGVLVETTPSSLRMVATNGRQLALAEAPAPGFPAGLQRVVPPQLLAAAERHLKGRGAVALSLGAASVRLCAAGLALTGRTLAGTYPNYAQVLPKKPTTVIQLPTAALRQAVRRIATVARAAEYRAVVLCAEGGGLRMWTRKADVGTAHEALDAAVLGDAVTVAFNATMMEDVLDSITADEVRLRVHGPEGGILADGRGDDPVRSLWLVMPVAPGSIDCTEPEAPREAEGAPAAPVARAA